MFEGLTLKQARFARAVAENEILEAEGRGLSATKLAVRCGYSEITASQSASENLRNPKVLTAIEERKKDLAAAASLTPEWILRQWMLMASADPAELVSIVKHRCDSCWPMDDADLPINPECRRCRGEGASYVRLGDTRKVSVAARLIYRGAKQTKDGIEVKLADPDVARKYLADYLGMLNKSQLSGPGGGPIAIDTATPDDLTDEQLLAIIHAGSAKLGVDEGVSGAGLLPATTIEGSYQEV